MDPPPSRTTGFAEDLLTKQHRNQRLISINNDSVLSVTKCEYINAYFLGPYGLLYIKLLQFITNIAPISLTVLSHRHQNRTTFATKTSKILTFLSFPHRSKASL